jgi:hypothetical protein
MAAVGLYCGRRVWRLASTSFLLCWFLLPSSPSDSCAELSVKCTRNQRLSSNSSHGFVLTRRTETPGEPWWLLKVVQRKTERHLLQLARACVAHTCAVVCGCTNHALCVGRHKLQNTCSSSTDLQWLWYSHCHLYAAEKLVQSYCFRYKLHRGCWQYTYRDTSHSESYLNRQTKRWRGDSSLWRIIISHWFTVHRVTKSQ